MKLKLLSLATAGLIASQANAGTVTTDGQDIIINTKGGFEARTADGDYSFKIGGRIMLDYNSYDGVINKAAGDETGSDLFFRRARIEMKGHANDWKYGLSYNLTDSGSIDKLNTTYTGFGKMTQLTFGQQKENFGLDDTGSSKWIAGVERSFVSDAFDTGNTVGAKLHGANNFLTYSLGVYKEGIDSDNDLDMATTGRVVVRPIYENGTVLHVGAGATYRDGMFDDDLESRLGVRGGEDKTANKFEPNFTVGDGDSLHAYNLELAYANGQFQVVGVQDDTGSSKWIAGVERSFVSDAFDTGNTVGAKLHGANNFLTYSLGVYKEGIDSDNDLDMATTGRVVVRPIYENGTVLHVGAGATYRDGMFDDDLESRLGVRGGEDKTANKFEPNFTVGDGDSLHAYNLELAYANGPLQIMAEYFMGEIDAPDAVVGSDDIEVDGYYVQAGYFLTGESRKYKTDIAAFDKVKPSSASGAWEVFGRYSMMNADMGSNITLIGGEDASVATLGVNYYPNSNVKVALNYVTAETDTPIGGEDDGDAIVGRLQFAF